MGERRHTERDQSNTAGAAGDDESNGRRDGQNQDKGERMGKAIAREEAAQGVVWCGVCGVCVCVQSWSTSVVWLWLDKGRGVWLK